MKRNNQLKAKYALRKIICFSGRHIDKNYVSFIFLAFRKKGSLIVVLVERGKGAYYHATKL